MSTCAGSTQQAELTAADRARLDEICDQFEAEWRRHRWPRVEQYLTQCDERLRNSLLAELFRIDQHWRQMAADANQVGAEYNKRFPQQGSIVEEVWGPDQPQQTPPIAEQTLGPFERMQRIGEGGFGVVFRAWDSRHRREVALKIPRFGYAFTGDELERFLREAKAAGSLDHPGIARVWESGKVAGVTYISYQFVEGANLKARFAEFADRTPREIAALIRQLARAAQFAHDHRIVHRDIKPSNILLTKDDRPVLTDFGLALATGGDATRSLAARVGTLDYMSPEQASGASAQVDGRTDLWSLGVMMYELLTGAKPFAGSTDVELLRAIMQDQPAPPRKLRPGIPRDLDVLTTRCLQKKPMDRLTTCGLLADELERVELGEPIVSRPVSTIERGLRWCGRNPQPVSAFALILLATAFGTLSWGLRIADNRQNQNLVQQLQIEVESQNAQRRQLLAELLRRDEWAFTPTASDLAFVEDQFLTTEDRQLRRHAALLLVKHGRINATNFPPGTVRAQRCREILQSLLNSADGAAFDAQSRAQLAAALTRLDEDAE